MDNALSSIPYPCRPPASGESARQAILLLHGLGADGYDLLGLADPLAAAFPDAAFVAPHAPEPCDMAPFGYQWFSLRDTSPEAMLAGVTRAATALNGIIDATLEACGISEDRLTVIGFSQGTMTALYTCLRRMRPCAGIIGFSGALIGAETLAGEVTARPPVCLVHGEADEVVSFAAMEQARAALENVEVPVRAHAIAGLGHGIDGGGITIAVRFLREIESQRVFNGDE